MASSPLEDEGSQQSLAGYTLQDVNFGRLYKAATQTSKRVLKVVLLLMLTRGRVAQVDRWPDSIVDYCSRVLVWSNTKFRQSFNLEERTLLQCPAASTDMDVSLLCKLLLKLFGDLNLPESLWRAVRDLKNVRNRVCHEHILPDEAQLARNLSDLKAMYETLLDLTGEVFSADVEDFKKTFCAEVDEIMTSLVMVEASEYLDKVKKFRIELVGRFIMQGQRELMAHYAKLQVLNPFTWLSSERFPQMQVGRIFTPLLITEHSRSVEIAELLTTEVLNPDEKQASEALPDVLVLSGIGGCGKTSLCRFLLHDWCTKEGAIDSLRSLDILLYIEARNVASPSLVKFLQKTLLPETFRQFEEKDVLQALRQVAILYIIDGMDEATADARELVNDVFSQASGSRILVTTRPEFTSAVTQLAERHHLSYMTLKVHGFSDEGRRCFTSRVFASFVPDEDTRRCQEREFLKFLSTPSKGLAGYLRLPFTLALLICLWLDDNTRIAKVTSATRLYAEIFRLCSSKMATRLQSSAAPPPPLNLHGFVGSWLLALGREAYRMLEEGRMVIDDDTQLQLADLCETQGMNSLQVFSAFLQCEVHTGLLGVNYHFSFVHKSQAEYLAALYLSREVMTASQSSSEYVKSVMERFKIFRRENRSSIHDIILFSGSGAQWVNTWLFLVGHLCMGKASDKVLQAVVDAIVSVPGVKQNETTMWRLVEESGRHPLVRERVGTAMNINWNWRPNEVELCDATNPMLMLMQHTPFTPHSVFLRIVGSLSGALLPGEDGCPHHTVYHSLTPILTCLSQQPSCLVFLKLDEQYYTWGCKETADGLLRLLQPKGNVVYLMGHLGPEGAAALASFKKMGDLAVQVSEVATVEAMAKGLLGKHGGRVATLTLRLDIPWGPSPPSLPRLRYPASIDLVLRGIHDAVAGAVSQALAQLSLSFRHVDLVASPLTLDGARALLATLSARGVTVLGSITVRSPHALTEDARVSLQAMVKGGGALHWWS